MYKRRNNEPQYAVLNDQKSQEINQYGTLIETVPINDIRRHQSLNINDDDWVSDNPNRYKQHGFYFNADNCIGCHACEAACSEKNDTDSHIAFRSVGFVESGTYPNTQRLNISMACNHCDDPVCLKGCPTRAYTKFAEYGAVLQDPDICFGCGYCTWVCPYNAPQLDLNKGEVSKCNMCVDRLEVGLKPACVSACLGNALDFGVVENIPDNRTQAKTEMPGFPSPEITQPNIRFQQLRTPPNRDMNRVDSCALKYHREENSESFKPMLDTKKGHMKHWNAKKLFSSHENSHIIFTLTSQAVIGAFIILISGFFYLPMATLHRDNLMMSSLLSMILFISFGLFKLNLHLGKPQFFYRGFYNLRHSPVSREIAGVSLFFIGLVSFTFLQYFDNLFSNTLTNISVAIALFGAFSGGYYMIKLYLIKARPFWNHWYTGASFLSSGIILGSVIIIFNVQLFAIFDERLYFNLTVLICIGLIFETVGLIGHANTFKSASSEAAVSFYEQTTTFGYFYWLRNFLLGCAILLSLINLYTTSQLLWFYIVLGSLMLAINIIGRALFYVVVIPTTMPGAFFWRNQGFVEHAKDVGLAQMPQVGVCSKH